MLIYSNYYKLLIIYFLHVRISPIALIGLGMNVLGSAGQYTCGLYGLVSVIQEDPKITRAVFVGAAFSVCSGIKYVSFLLSDRSTCNEIIAGLDKLDQTISKTLLKKMIGKEKESILDRRVREEIEKSEKQDKDRVWF